ESHLKTTGCDTENPNFTPDVCLTDGSQFKYGTFDESCTDNICDTLTIDTNGKKGPNTAGKDRFTMNLTPNGLKALGESNSCETGLDCGAYILAHHKLFDGETSTPVVQNCSTSGVCCDAGYYVSNGNCVVSVGSVELEDGTVLHLSNVENANSYSAIGTIQEEGPDYGEPNYFAGAKALCESKGMELPDIDTLTQIYNHRDEYGLVSGLGGNQVFYSSTSAGSYYVQTADFMGGPMGTDPVSTSSNSSTMRQNVICVGK
ncbi:hypothetical protein IJ732_01240, partial [bacterium]|nr:hypothetical protein [bacterium]